MLLVTLTRMWLVSKENKNKFQILAHTDSLTGIYNRYGFDELAEQMITKNPEAKFVAVLLDIDDFKFVNDIYGHVYGDNALKSLADSMKAFFPSGALLGRNGGDEFVILFPETTPEQFQQTLEKIREDISRTPIEAGSPHLLSVSIGGVYGVPNLTDAIRQADQLMYLAKQQKNQVQYRIIMGGREK